MLKSQHYKLSKTQYFCLFDSYSNVQLCTANGSLAQVILVMHNDELQSKVFVHSVLVLSSEFVTLNEILLMLSLCSALKWWVVSAQIC